MANQQADRTGFDDTVNHLTVVIGRLVPQWLARRAIAVSISTDRARYESGDPVTIEIQFRNRLPVPLTISTPHQRLWGWAVDGALEASDEPRYLSTNEGTMTFQGRERKRVTREWDGTVKRAGSPDRWEPLETGTHELSAFIALEHRPRPEARTTIEIA
jgi:hypothetical protein